MTSMLTNYLIETLKVPNLRCQQPRDVKLTAYSSRSPTQSFINSRPRRKESYKKSEHSNKASDRKGNRVHHIQHLRMRILVLRKFTPLVPANALPFTVFESKIWGKLAISPGLYQADIRPIAGRYQAYIRPLSGL